MTMWRPIMNYDISNSRECIWYKKLYFYCKSHENPYQYYKSRENLHQHTKSHVHGIWTCNEIKGSYDKIIITIEPGYTT